MNEPLSPEGLAAVVMRAHVARLRGQSLERVRVVTQKSTYDALPGTELGQALRGHVAPLLWARLAEPHDERVREARSEEHEAHAFAEAPHASVDELLTLIATGPIKSVQDALSALPRVGRSVQEALTERAAVQREIETRLGAPDPFPTVPAQARRFFESTRDLARSVLPKDLDLAHVLVWLRGTQLHGLPARLSHAWLRDVLPDYAVPRLATEPLPRLFVQQLPEPLGITSFGRALRQLGEAVVVGAPLEPPEWVRRVDGAFFGPARVGLQFGALLGEPAFLARATDAAIGERQAFARALHVAALFEARALASRWVDGEVADAETFMRPLPSGLKGVLPRHRDDARVRFAAYLDHPALRDEARSLFDEDWFRNPRSRSWMMLPPPVELPDDAHVRLTKHFEATCG